MLYVVIILLIVAVIFWVMVSVHSRQKAQKKQERLETIARLKQGIEAGIISWRNNLYYWKQDGSPLCEMEEAHAELLKKEMENFGIL